MQDISRNIVAFWSLQTVIVDGLGGSTFYSILFNFILFYWESNLICIQFYSVSYSILFYFILIYAILFCPVLFYSVLSCCVVLCSILFLFSFYFYSILFYPILSYPAFLKTTPSDSSSNTTLLPLTNIKERILSYIRLVGIGKTYQALYC